MKLLAAGGSLYFALTSVVWMQCASGLTKNIIGKIFTSSLIATGCEVKKTSRVRIPLMAFSKMFFEEHFFILKFD